MWPGIRTVICGSAQSTAECAVDRHRDARAGDDADHVHVGLSAGIHPRDEHLSEEPARENRREQLCPRSQGTDRAHVRIGQVPSAPGTCCHVMDSCG